MSEHHAPAVDRTEAPVISFSEIARAAGRYLPAFLLTLVAAALIYLVYAMVVVMTAPVERTTAIAFRAEFDGADRGEYPNGLKFNSTDIVATSILRRVHETNRLDRFVPFTAFKNSVFIAESNNAIENIDREYRAKLSDAKLTAVDRDRLEAEYKLKRNSLSHLEFSINYATAGDEKRRIPPTLLEKSLKDTLRFWAEDQTENKGAVRYRFPIITAHGVDERLLRASEPILQLEILRTKVNLTLGIVNEFLKIPGAELVRSPDTRWSLTDVRSRLQDLERFRLQPLQSSIVNEGLIVDRRAVTQFVDSQISYTERETLRLRGEADALRNAIQLYDSTRVEEGRRPPEGSASNSGDAAAEGVTPMLSDTFLDRLVDLTSDSRDKEYRQKTIGEYRQRSLAILPLEQELAYYISLRHRLNASASVPRPGLASASVSAQQEEILTRFLETLSALERIYNQISQSQNSSGSLYTITGTPVQRTERTASIPRLLLNGALALLLTIPLFLVAAFVHYRLQRESAEEHRALESRDVR